MRALLLLAILPCACLALDDPDALCQRLSSPDPAVRVAAMQSIRRLSTEARQALEKRISHASPEVAMRLWRSLHDQPVLEPSALAVAVRATGAEGRAWWVALAHQHDVLRVLQAFPGLPDEAVVALLSPATGGDRATRPERPTLSSPPAAMPAALGLMTRRSAAVRAALARWLGRISGKEARGALVTLSRDEAPDVRVDAIRALAPRFADARNERDFLLGQVCDPSPDVRAEAFRLLTGRGDARADLAAWMRTHDLAPVVREAALAYVASRDLPWVLPCILRVRSEDPRRAEDEALHAGANPLAIVGLAEHLDTLPKAALPVALRVLDVLSRQARCPGPTSAPPLIPGPADPVVAWRTWAADARAFFASDTPRALEAAETALGTKNAREAEEIIEKVLRAHPRLPIALALMADVCVQRKEPVKAREWLAMAIDADPAEPAYRKHRAALASDAGDHAAALADLVVSVGLRPRDVSARFSLGYELLAVGRYAEGVTEFRRVVEQDPANTDARYNIACGLARMGQKEEALGALSDAVKAGFHDPEAARRDEDLASLRDDPRFERILDGTFILGDWK